LPKVVVAVVISSKPPALRIPGKRASARCVSGQNCA
jgi:hypothetical protein